MLTVVLCLANRLGLHNYRAEVGEGLDGDAVAVLEPHYTQVFERLLVFTHHNRGARTSGCSRRALY